MKYNFENDQISLFTLEACQGEEIIAVDEIETCFKLIPGYFEVFKRYYYDCFCFARCEDQPKFKLIS